MRIVVFCHPSEEDAWSPSALLAGIGGSEEAVIHVVNALARRGHEVTVVNSRFGADHRIGGVTWTSYERTASPAADIGVIWRRAWRVAEVRGAARRFYLWVHDYVPQSDILPYLKFFAKVMVLSRFHRARYPLIPSERVFVTANGIDPAQFGQSESRDHRLMVYGSCYSRGLLELLTNWRRIRAAVPGARLNVFYGWQTLQKIRPERCRRLRHAVEPLLAQRGVTHLGRISHEAVAGQYSAAGIWAYPCSYPETSCISAMKAQAAGAVPVVIASGALAETVGFGFKTMRGYTDFAGLPVPRRRIVEEWLEGLIDMLRSPERQARIRRDMVPISQRRFAWPHVVETWEREFQAA